MAGRAPHRHPHAQPVEREPVLPGRRRGPPEPTRWATSRSPCADPIRPLLGALGALTEHPSLRRFLEVTSTIEQVPERDNRVELEPEARRPRHAAGRHALVASARPRSGPTGEASQSSCEQLERLGAGPRGGPRDGARSVAVAAGRHLAPRGHDADAPSTPVTGSSTRTAGSTVWPTCSWPAARSSPSAGRPRRRSPSSSWRFASAITCVSDSPPATCLRRRSPRMHGHRPPASPGRPAGPTRRSSGPPGPHRAR